MLGGQKGVSGKRIRIKTGWYVRVSSIGTRDNVVVRVLTTARGGVLWGKALSDQRGYRSVININLATPLPAGHSLVYLQDLTSLNNFYDSSLKIRLQSYADI